MRVFNSYKTSIPTLKEALDSIDEVEETEVPVEGEDLPSDDVEVPADAPVEEVPADDVTVEEEPAADPVADLTPEDIEVLKKVLAAYEGTAGEGEEVCPECGEGDCTCSDDTYEGEVIDDDLGDTVELVATEDLPEPDEDSNSPYFG